MTTTASKSEDVDGKAPRRTVKVTSAMIESARTQVAISKQLGLPVSKVVEKIAAVR